MSRNLPFDSGALRPRATDTLPAFDSVEDVVATVADDMPIQVLYPERIAARARAFMDAFPGRVMYAVKCNPDPAVLQALAGAGLRDFDVASIAEIEAVRTHAPGAAMHFMHPVKNRKAIRHACLAGVRSFALDSLAELAKIAEETASADLDLTVRMALPRGEAALDLSGKFGIAGDEAVALLRAARRRARRLMISFHVGSQCMTPAAYGCAIDTARALLDRAGVAIDALDIGGGFPVPYPGMTAPPLSAFVEAIADGVRRNGFGHIALVAEPGRALVAESGSILARVELRKGDALYLNDGTYGALFDAGSLGWRYPTRLVRTQRGEAPVAEQAFRFFGPTCDSLDAMPGPFHLPGDVQEGDWIEIGHLGAYGACMRTAFNGFHDHMTVAVYPGRVDAADPCGSATVPSVAVPAHSQ